MIQRIVRKALWGLFFFAFFEKFFVPILTSGGPASFVMPLQIGKTPIVVPRQHQFNEHVNDHQVEFARNVAKRMTPARSSLPSRPRAAIYTYI